MKYFNRREFLKWSLAGVGGMAVGFPRPAYLQPISVENPLEAYPDRDWEKIYRDKFRYDETFTFLCAPNDTHDCLLRAYVRNGVITRVGPTYGYGKTVDPYGNKPSHRWEPRCCQKALTLPRRFYGDRRVKGAMVRKGFYDWVKAGFPRDPDTGRVSEQYLRRGKDKWLNIKYDDAYEMVARTYMNIAKTYSGPKGAEYLRRQGYDEEMIEKMKEAGTLTLKHRGGMHLLGLTRIAGLGRMANMMALLDDHIRKTGPERAVGGRYWDNYSWHTDLPPGHPMVTGQQTVDFELHCTEHAGLITLWGMNWSSTKMPDAHWLSEAKLRGTKVVNITIDYQSTANKSDEVIIIRPGTDQALALGIAHVLMNENLFDHSFVKSFTDLPLLLRMDNLKLLRPSEITSGYKLAELKNYTKIVKPGEPLGPGATQGTQFIPERLREEWGDFTVWNLKTATPSPLHRDQVGDRFLESGIDPALSGSFRVKLVDGREIEVKPLFEVIREYLREFTPETVSEITWAPKEAILNLAREIAGNKSKTLFAVGMGPNHYFNAGLKDRGIFLVSALTRNIGHIGGSPGSFAGNYRIALFNGAPQFLMENPFDIELEPSKPSKTKGYFQFESAHYYNYGDRPLRIGNKLFTGRTHMPTPTKLLWWANSNSILGNAKWAYDIIHHTLPRMEALIVNEWWWSMSCEYADVVFGVDSWAEFKHPDFCGSVTNPFLTVYPRTPLKRIFPTVSDIETYAGVAKKMAAMTGEKRFEDYWRFVHEGKVDVYIQRILNASSTTKGYRIEAMEKNAREGIPALKLLRTYPKVLGWEQTNESKPWYTKTGRLEFYREEPEFIEHGENLPVYREPIDATFYEPNVIVGNPDHPALRPLKPEHYGLRREDLSVEVRQVRNIVKPWSELKKTKHPRIKDGLTLQFLTPKYRHGAHTTPIDSDVISVYFGPFGDIKRHDKRNPWVGEIYVNLNPKDAKEFGIEDGDYIWIDADPDDRPYRGWKKSDEDYKVMRLMARARYFTGIPRGVLIMFFNAYQASHGTVRAHETNPDGLAKNPLTNYQSMSRYGGHQSCTRAWLGPTLMTDTMTRKETFGQLIGKGFAPDIHCVIGAPKESFVKITKAEPGGLDKKGLWRPVALGFRPTYENEAMKRYLKGEFIKAVQ
ncbi:MAG: molybdopterin-dependent oxidoreductase [Thermodesulfobacteriota bacterium]|nr:molybdopterin-dependent oxidoreductase [Thermodesulfobacteriota bacterium]